VVKGGDGEVGGDWGSGIEVVLIGWDLVACLGTAFCLLSELLGRIDV